MLAPTPRERLVDPQGRPYFLWDSQMTLEEFERIVRDPAAEERPYLVGKVMRQAKPDDALQFVSPQEMADLWPSIERYLGKSKPFWSWLLHLGHRTTRDLDLFLCNRETLAEVPPTVVDSPRAILAEKLCALLERSETRDLIDVEALMDRGAGLETALTDAPRRDSGFSPLTLAWVLRGLEIRPSIDLDEAAADRLNRFKLRLIERLVSPPT